MNESRLLRFTLVGLSLLVALDLATRVAMPVAHAANPTVKCDVTTQRGLTSAEKYADEVAAMATAVIGAGGGNALVVPVTAQGTLTRVVICTW